jgi:DNA-binding GntR family transcriptional regulator
MANHDDEQQEGSFPRIKPRVMRQEALDALRNAILNEELPVGSRILESDVAEQMGVSRAPIREAIRQLEQEGLVQIFPHRGAVVLGLPETEIDAIYEMRAVIEARAMARVALTLTEEEDQELLEIIDKMREALDLGDIDQVAELDWQLHGRIIDMSGFTLLRRTWSSLDGLVRLRSFQALKGANGTSDYFKNTAIASHMALLEALRSGDPEVAAKAGAAHVLEVPTLLGRYRQAKETYL